MTSLRVLHCPGMVGGNPHSLARAERELGLKSWAVAFRQNYFNYEADEVLANSRLGLEIKRWWLLWRAIKDFNVVHFNFGESIAPQWFPEIAARTPLRSLFRWMYNIYTIPLELRDLPLLKKAGKGIVVTYQGDDARQGDYLANFEISPVTEVEPDYYSAAWDTRKQRRIAEFTKYADRIYALNPDLLYVLPPQAQFMPYAHIDLREWQVVNKNKSSSEVPVILHAPTHRGTKGSRFILDAISRLQAEGIPLEFILVEGLSHAEARQTYDQADLLIDQLLSGWYGGLAVELMALGKPVICYIREDDLKFIPQQMRAELPIIKATPATLYAVLKEWLTVRKYELAEVGQRGRAYVERWHDPLKIAAQLKGEYEAIMASKHQQDRR